MTAATRVLVFPCGSEIGLELGRALGHATHIEMVGASSVASNHGRYMFADYIDGMPMVDEPGFVGAVSRVCREKGIDFVFPAMDTVLWSLSACRDQIGAELVTSPPETVHLCASKRRTYQALAGKVRVPHEYHPREVPGAAFPVFIKPECGFGSNGARQLSTAEDLASAVAETPDTMVLEYLPGAEYTVDCFTDRHGVLRYAAGRARARTMKGISVDTYAVDRPEFTALAETIQSEFLFRGMWFFQVREAADGELALLEVAPRVAGAMGLQRYSGVNLPLLALYDRMGLDIDLRPNPVEVRMDRALAPRFSTDVAYDAVYIDFDDTVVSRNGSLDPLAVAFLAQCRNRGVGVTLLSRHDGDLDARLNDYGIGGLFERVVHITNGAKKSTFIESGPAIFIDDSFAERREVFDACAIPTYAPEMLEVLMDWRR